MKNAVKRSIYIFFGTGLLILLCLLIYIAAGFSIDTVSDRAAGSFCLLTPESFVIVEDSNSPLGLHKEIELMLGELPGSGSSLIFYSKHEYIEVYIDSEQVFSLRPDRNNTFTRTTGSNWCNIPIYQSDEGSRVKIVLTPVYKSLSHDCPDFYLGSELSIIKGLVMPNLPIFAVSLAAVVCGIIFIIFALVNIGNPQVDKSLFMIGAFAILVGTWKITDLDTTALLFKNSVSLVYATYFSLLLLPIPFIMFLKKSFKDSDNILWYIPCALDILAFVIIIILQLAYISDIRESLWLVHAAMLANIPVVAFMFHSELKKYGWNKKLKLTFICSTLCLVGLIADVLTYYITNGASKAFLGISSFLFYIISLGVTTLEEAKQLMAIGSRAKQFEKLAYHDQLTGLYNRTAYAEYTGGRDFRPEGHIVVMFDLNNLKTCNDTLGHDHGDSYIINSARIIEAAFGSAGKCYRMGGDEFCALLHGVSVSMCMECVVRLKKMLDEYNAAHSDSFPIHIAWGYGLYNAEEDYDIGDTLRRADKMMYNEKFEMKKLNNEAVR